MTAASFLADLELRPLTLADAGPLEPLGLAIGPGSGGLEIAVARSERRPTQDVMRTAWKNRQGGRATPVLLVSLYSDRGALCGPSGEMPPVFLDLDIGQVERICRTALAEPNRHSATRFLLGVLPEVSESQIPGLRNQGLFATHELEKGVPRRPDWAQSHQKASSLLGKRGRDLLAGLGFQVAETNQQYAILRCGQTKMAVAVFLDRSEASDIASDRFGGMTPVQYALAKADDENLDYVVVDRGSSLRIHTAAGKGVGRRGRTETFVEIHLDLLPTDRAGYLWLLFSGPALAKEGSFTKILEESQDYASDLGSRLRDRIYDFVIPRLAIAIAKNRNLRTPTAQDLKRTYEMALLALFRLLFIAYAEDKDLLPYRTNERYRDRSLKKKAREMAVLRQQGTPTFDDSTSHWDEVVRLFRVVNTGKPKEWGVPVYDGGMFSDEAAVSPAGSLLTEVCLTNKDFGPVLCDLLVDPTPEGFGPVDFRSLGVRDFGTIYEGLLESELSVAEEDLAVDREGQYVPARRQEPKVRKGHIYLHNASGARKATGSYYTKSFAVDHLLDHALEPAIADHLARLDKLDDRRAAESFFDFRVADIAMGSGHFLVAAVDRIERRFSSYLAKRPLPGVMDELARLRKAALDGIEQAGGSIDGVEIENVQLLRRQIARRCIYGVDINNIAVQLARLSLWIHTFVPGLPLSFLDHNIVCGNSLVGIATVDEVNQLVKRGGAMPLFDHSADALIGSAREAVGRLARLSEANAAEIAEARRAYEGQRRAVVPTARMLDVLAASRLPDWSERIAPEDFEAGSQVIAQAHHGRAVELLGTLTPFHFPIAFPAVFLRDRSGFDVILGNPPWEKARVEDLEFWARYYPGLRGLRTGDRNQALRAIQRARPDLEKELNEEKAASSVLRDAVRPLPGMNTGHPDLFRAFLWRFIQLAANDGGRIGVVLPGDAFKIKGSAVLRQVIAERLRHLDLQMLTNRRGWVFDDVHQQKLIALCCGTAGTGARSCEYVIRPEIHSADGWRSRDPLARIEVERRWLTNYSTSLVAPIIPSAVESKQIIDVLMRHPPIRRHKSLYVRRVYADFETSRGDARRWHPNPKSGDWPVYKGESFDLWNPDTGSYYGWTDGAAIAEAAHDKRLRCNTSSPYSLLPEAWRNDPNTHPMRHPRIAFRDVTNRGNSRTLIAALIPAQVVTTQTAPWVLWLDHSDKERRDAFLLGVLSSIPLDWWARRFIEGHADQEAFDSLRVPDFVPGSALVERTVALAGRLACPDKRFAKWAKAVGVEYGRLDATEKDDMIAELDAVVAHLYGLSEPQLTHIFETFHEGWDYQPRLTAVLGHYTAWARNV